MELNFKYADPGLSLLGEAKAARELLEAGKCKGSEFLGWLNLPQAMASEIPRIEEAAAKIRRADGLIVVGIGGSYLGARAVIEALGSDFPVTFAGHNMDSLYHSDLLSLIEKKKYAVNVISKSGTTTEPGLAFRILLKSMEGRFSKDELSNLVFVTTDAKKGSLRPLVAPRGWMDFEI